MSATYPTPWTFEAEDVFEDSPIRAANGEYVLVRDNGVYPPDLDTCREIVEAVNWYCDWGAMSAELERLRDERDRLAAEEARYRTQNVVLRDIARRMANMLEHVSNEHHFDFYELVREARAAIGEEGQSK